MERIVLLADRDVVTRDLLYFNGNREPHPTNDLPDDHFSSLKEVVQDAESLAIKQMLELTEGNRTLAAKQLGIGRRTLYAKIDAYGI